MFFRATSRAINAQPVPVPTTVCVFTIHVYALGS
jgi:hypothetical protein